MRISDWSSDVCSSDLAQVQQHQLRQGLRDEAGLARAGDAGDGRQHAQRNARIHAMQVVAVNVLQLQPAGRFAFPASRRGDHIEQVARSEEHTSELQSLMRNSYAVFLLQNKNT